MSSDNLHTWATQPLFSWQVPHLRELRLVAIHWDLILLSMTEEEASVLSSYLPFLPQSHAEQMLLLGAVSAPKNFLVYLLCLQVTHCS